jgi:hypothetical protein
MRSKAQKVIRHRETVEIPLSHFPSIVNYVDEKFPTIDLSHVKIYQTSLNALKAVDFDNIGGCYIDALKIIFVLNQGSLDKRETGKGKFSNALLNATWTRLAMVDILVHEVLHAVSSSMGRATQKYEYAEEEFVYTHCIDFYRQEGMTDDVIIRRHFLQFCLNDVLSSKQEMAEVFIKLKTAKSLPVIPWEEDYDRYQYQDFLNRHAEALVSIAIKAAEDKADIMIESYNKYGCRSASAEDVDYDTSIRFQSLNFD